MVFLDHGLHYELHGISRQQVCLCCRYKVRREDVREDDQHADDLFLHVSGDKSQCLKSRLAKSCSQHEHKTSFLVDDILSMFPWSRIE